MSHAESSCACAEKENIAAKKVSAMTGKSFITAEN
jgi:hypothetical protein